ncbi:MAG: transporter [Elusimicrobia bacterium]|nr:transporter [Elusimicrobiota bacterium]
MSVRSGIAAVLFIAAFILCPVGAFAYRPFATEDAGVAGRGVAQLELSRDYLNWEGDKENMGLLVPVYGVSRVVELSAEIPYLMHDYKGEGKRNGIGDINLVGKFLLVEENAGRPSLVLKSAVKTKSGDEAKGLGSGDMDYNITAAASKVLGTLTLHGMFGYTFVGDNGDDSVRNISLYGLAADYSVTARFHLAAEISGSKHPEMTLLEDPLSALLGVARQLSDKLVLDAGLRYSFNKAMPKWSTTIGASLTF